jgi:hypothetical protein
MDEHPLLANVESAPIIFFEGVSTFSNLNGVVGLMLVAGLTLPKDVAPRRRSPRSLICAALSRLLYPCATRSIKRSCSARERPE